MTTATEVNREIKTVDVDTANRWLEAGEAVLVDVRELDEHAAERIPGATVHPLSRFDPHALAGEHGDLGRKVLVHCRTGRRSAEACARLAGTGQLEVFNVTGGLEEWKSKGLPIDRQAGVPISVMRQVQIVIGVLVLLGVAGGLTLSPWIFILPAFLGAGLTFAGVTGTCGLAAILSRMPWNRAFRCEAGNGGTCG